jgi:hypothetical protein
MYVASAIKQYGMKRIAVLALLLIISSCVSQNNKDTKLRENNIFIKIRFKDIYDMQPRIVGSTNLPNNTMLSVSMKKKGVWGRITNAKVMHGKFQTKRFNVVKKPLSAGIYHISIMTPLPSLQQQSVRNIIGEKGENLKGNLVRNIYGFSVVQLETSLILGCKKPNSTDDNRVKKLQRKEVEKQDDEFQEKLQNFKQNLIDHPESLRKIRN